MAKKQKEKIEPVEQPKELETTRDAKVILLTALADSELNKRFAYGDEYPCDTETATRLIERGMAKEVE